MLEDKVAATLSALGTIATKQLTGSKYSDGELLQFKQARREQREERFRKFMSQKVLVIATDTPIAHTRKKRSEIVDMDMATQDVISELSVINHPVAQLNSHLKDRYAEYGHMIGDTPISEVMAAIIEYVQPKRLKAAVDQQVDAQRPQRQIYMAKPRLTTSGTKEISKGKANISSVPWTQKNQPNTPKNSARSRRHPKHRRVLSDSASATAVERKPKATSSQQQSTSPGRNVLGPRQQPSHNYHPRHPSLANRRNMWLGHQNKRRQVTYRNTASR
jgi:hypothetical protein